jgi:hypothetical protein
MSSDRPLPGRFSGDQVLGKLLLDRRVSMHSGSFSSNMSGRWLVNISIQVHLVCTGATGVLAFHVGGFKDCTTKIYLIISGFNTMSAMEGI